MHKVSRQQLEKLCKSALHFHFLSISAYFLDIFNTCFLVTTSQVKSVKKNQNIMLNKPQNLIRLIDFSYLTSLTFWKEAQKGELLPAQTFLKLPLLSLRHQKGLHRYIYTKLLLVYSWNWSQGSKATKHTTGWPTIRLRKVIMNILLL